MSQTPLWLLDLLLSFCNDFALKKTGSESELASDAGEEMESSVQSAAEHSDGASAPDMEYVNRRGVRFAPDHQTTKDGTLFCVKRIKPEERCR